MISLIYILITTENICFFTFVTQRSTETRNAGSYTKIFFVVFPGTNATTATVISHAVAAVSNIKHL